MSGLGIRRSPPPAYGYALFYTSAAAFRAERVAALAGLAGARLVPTPRELSSDCGVALRFDMVLAVPGPSGADAGPIGAAAAVRAALEAAGVPFDRIVAPG